MRKNIKESEEDMQDYFKNILQNISSQLFPILNSLEPKTDHYIISYYNYNYYIIKARYKVQL